MIRRADRRGETGLPMRGMSLRRLAQMQRNHQSCHLLASRGFLLFCAQYLPSKGELFACVSANPFSLVASIRAPVQDRFTGQRPSGLSRSAFRESSPFNHNNLRLGLLLSRFVQDSTVWETITYQFYLPDTSATVTSLIWHYKGSDRYHTPS